MPLEGAYGETRGFFSGGDALVWERGDVVLLLDPTEGELGPTDDARFSRFAEVVSVEAGGADREKVLGLWPGSVNNKEHNIPVASVDASNSRVGRSQVVLRVLGEPERDPVQAQIGEVHVQLPLSGGAVCSVVRKPQSKVSRTRGGQLKTYRDWIEPDAAEKAAGTQSVRLREHVVILPLKLLPLRVAKFDVRLKEMPLQAVRAVQAMLTRMVLFLCNTCRERFPAFHPAYEPPGHVGLELLKHGADGVARCNVEVARWDEVPSAPDAEALMAVRGVQRLVPAVRRASCAGVRAAAGWGARCCAGQVRCSEPHGPGVEVSARRIGEPLPGGVADGVDVCGLGAHAGVLRDGAEDAFNEVPQERDFHRAGHALCCAQRRSPVPL